MIHSKKILVVDDDEGILDAISLLLEDEGYTVKTTNKGEDVSSTIDVFHPDIILLDVLLSGKDGRDICRKLKTDSKKKDIPIVLISAHPGAEKTIKACGAEGFLAKPFETKDLLRELKTVTSKDGS